MKTLKTICLLLAMLAVCACDNAKDQLVGKWQSDQLVEDGVTLKITLTFQENGNLTAFFVFDGRDDSAGVEMGIKGTLKTSGTWSLEGENVTFSLDENSATLNVTDIYSPDTETNAMLQYYLQNEPSAVQQVKNTMMEEVPGMINEINGIHIIESISETTLLLQGEDGTETYHRK